MDWKMGDIDQQTTANKGALKSRMPDQGLNLNY